MIYATSLSGVIGNRGDLPWPHMAADMKWFQSHTKGKIVVMGRTTWDSLPKKLPNRINVVITTKTDIQGPDLLVSGDPDEIMHIIKQTYPDHDIVIIGGATVYAEFWEYAELIHVTLVQQLYHGDTFFDCRGMMQQAYKLEYSVRLPGNDNMPDLLFETYRRPLN